MRSRTTYLPAKPPRRSKRPRRLTESTETPCTPADSKGTPRLAGLIRQKLDVLGQVEQRRELLAGRGRAVDLEERRERVRHYIEFVRHVLIQY